MKIKRLAFTILLTILISHVEATQLSSASYKIPVNVLDQSGGQSNSTNYNLCFATGEPIVGNPNSISYKAYLGFFTPNSPLGISSADVFPDNPATTEDLNCSWIITDPDVGDVLKANVTWYNGSQHITAYDANEIPCQNGSICYTTTPVPSSATRKGELWRCHIKAYDQNGAVDQENATETIGNTPPTVWLLDIDEKLNNTCVNNATPPVRFNSTDSDGDNMSCILYFNDTNKGTAQVQSGSGAVINATTTSDGCYWVNITCDDGTDKNSSRLWFVTIDTTLPSVTINHPTPNSTLNSTNITLNTTITDARSGVSVCWYSLDNWVTNVTYNCNYTTFIASEGSNTVRTAANDSAGNLNNTESVTFTVDTTAPITTATAVTDTGSSYTFNTWTNSVYVNVTLNCSNGCNVTQYCTDTNNSCTPNQIYSAPVKITAEGVSYIRFRSNDSAGNLETTKNQTIRIDTALPSVTINEPTAMIYNSANITLSTTITDATSGVNVCWYSLDNWATNVTYDCNHTTFIALEGSNTVRVAANDTTGNLNDTESVTFTVDTTAPTTTAAAETDTGSNYVFNTWTPSHCVNVTLNCSNGPAGCDMTQHCTDTLNNCTPNTTYSAPVHITTGGVSYIRFRSNDTLGNLETTKNQTIKIDTTTPSVIINEPTAMIYNYTNITLNTTITDATSGVNVCWYSLDNWATNVTYDCNHTTFIALEGSNTIRVAANDTTGNLNDTESVTFTVDTTAPTTTAAAETDTGSNYVFNTWTASSYVNVTLNCSNGPAGCDVTQYCTDTLNNCTPNITYNSPIQISTEGRSYIRFRSNDTVGNLETTKNQTIRIDTTTPQVNLENPANNTIETHLNTITFNYNVTDQTSDVANCSLYINGILNQTNNSINESMTQNFTQTLTNGYYNWSISCYDLLGWRGESAIWHLNVTVEAPTVTLETPIDYYNSNTSTIIFNCSATDDVSLANITLYGSWGIGWHLNETRNRGGISNSTQFTKTITEGTFTWNCLAYDNSGFYDWGDLNLTFTVDTIPPTINFTDPTPTNGSIQGSRTLTINVTHIELHPDTLILMWNGSLEAHNYLGSYTNITKTNLLDGTYTYYVRVNDSAGNFKATETRTVTVNATTPQVTLISPQDNAQRKGNLTFTCSATDDIQLVNITLYWNYSGLWQANGTHPVSGTLNETSFIRLNLSEGPLTWNCYACDNSSNCDFSPLNYTVLIDNTPPATVTGLGEVGVGDSWILWNWSNPPDPDFNHTEIWVDGVWEANVSAPDHSYRAGGLHSGTEYEIQTRTADHAGNVNKTWVNDTAKTKSSAYKSMDLEITGNCTGKPIKATATCRGKGVGRVRIRILEDNRYLIYEGKMNDSGEINFIINNSGRYKLIAERSGYKDTYTRFEVGGCRGEHREDCGEDIDCLSGYCVNSSCVECLADESCEATEYCLDGFCEPIACDGYIVDHRCYMCINNSDCTEYEICVNHSCSNITCRCGYISGHRCIRYECCFDLDCTEYEVCVNHSCSNITCRCGYIQNHSCIEYGCCSDIDCGRDEICKDHVCEALPEPELILSNATEDGNITIRIKNPREGLKLKITDPTGKVKEYDASGGNINFTAEKSGDYKVELLEYDSGKITVLPEAQWPWMLWLITPAVFGILVILFLLKKNKRKKKTSLEEA